MSKRKTYTDADVRAYLQNYTSAIIACVQPQRQQPVAKAINAAVKNHSYICAQMSSAARRALHAKNQTEWFAYASQLIGMRVKATGFALEDSNDPIRVQEISDIFMRLNALNGIANSADKVALKHMAQDCSAEIPVYVEAINCCCTAAILGRAAVEIWPVPPEIWMPHKYALTDSGYMP